MQRKNGIRPRSTVAVIGGGISGLTTAWWLHKAGVDVAVLEAEDEVGGTMKTIHEKGWLVETGPNSALETSPLFQTLVRDLALSDELVYANELASKRYILRGGELHPLPMTPVAFFRSRLWSARAKLRLLAEPFIGRATREESVAEFVQRRLGTEFLDYAINPFVAGVYAGNAEELSVQSAFPKLYTLEKKYGSLIKGQILGARERKKRAEQSKNSAKMFSFRNGMQALPKALGQALGDCVHTHARIDSIRRVRGKFELRGTKNRTPFRVAADALVSAIPAFQLASLLLPLDEHTASALSSIVYPPVVEVFLGLRESDVRRALDGFGFLVPAKERRNILGTIWSSSLFAERAPGGHVALTSFVGGSRQPELTNLTDRETYTIVMNELRDLMGVSGRPTYRRIARWKRAIPQYRLGYANVLDELGEFEDKHSGFFISGNFRGGISVGDCVASSETTAERVLAFLHSQQEN